MRFTTFAPKRAITDEKLNFSKYQEINQVRSYDILVNRFNVVQKNFKATKLELQK